MVDNAEVDLVFQDLDIGDLLGSKRVLDSLPETVRVVLHSLVDQRVPDRLVVDRSP